MKKLGWVGVGVAVLLLSGCSAPSGQSDVTTTPSAAAKAPEATPSSEPTAAAIEMEPSTDDAPLTAAQEAGFKDENDWFLRSIKSSWAGGVPTDDQLLGAAATACEQLANDIPIDDVVAVVGDGESAANNNRNLTGYAQMAICPAG